MRSEGIAPQPQRRTMLYASPSPQKSNSNIARPQTNRVSRPGSKLTEGGYKEDYNKRVSKIHSKPPILLCSSHMLRKLRSTKGANLMQRACDAYWQKGGTTRRERIILRANTLRCPCTNPSIALCFALRHFPTPPSPPPPCRQKREKSSWNRERSCAGARSTQQGKPRSRAGAVYVLRTRQSSSLTLLIRLSAMFRADWFRPWWHFGYSISQRKKEKERIFFLYSLESFPLNDNANGWWSLSGTKQWHEHAHCGSLCSNRALSVATSNDTDKHAHMLARAHAPARTIVHTNTHNTHKKIHQDVRTPTHILWDALTNLNTTLT